jgi:carbon storage regulator
MRHWNVISGKRINGTPIAKQPCREAVGMDFPNLKVIEEGGAPVLILRRKVGEKIVIGDGITVVVSRVSGGRVTLGIEAPDDVHIVRGELRVFDEHRPRQPVVPVLVGPADGVHHAISQVPQLPR